MRYKPVTLQFGEGGTHGAGVTTELCPYLNRCSSTTREEGEDILLHGAEFGRARLLHIPSTRFIFSSMFASVSTSEPLEVMVPVARLVGVVVELTV